MESRTKVAGLFKAKVGEGAPLLLGGKKEPPYFWGKKGAPLLLGKGAPLLLGKVPPYFWGRSPPTFGEIYLLFQGAGYAFTALTRT